MKIFFLLNWNKMTLCSSATLELKGLKHIMKRYRHTDVTQQLLLANV